MWTCEHSIETTASPGSIWRLWSDVASWGDWNADIERVELSGPFARGSTITMTPIDQDAVELRIAETSEPNLFVDEADYGNVLIQTIHRIEPLDGGRSLVTNRMEISGPAADAIGPELGPKSAATSPRHSPPWSSRPRRWTTDDENKATDERSERRANNG